MSGKQTPHRRPPLMGSHQCLLLPLGRRLHFYVSVKYGGGKESRFSKHLHSLLVDASVWLGCYWWIQQHTRIYLALTATVDAGKESDTGFSPVVEVGSEKQLASFATERKHRVRDEMVKKFFSNRNLKWGSEFLEETLLQHCMLRTFTWPQKKWGGELWTYEM